MGMNRVIRSNYQALKDELLRDPGVVNVTAANARPTYVGNINPFWWEGRNPGQYETMNFVATDRLHQDFEWRSWPTGLPGNSRRIRRTTSLTNCSPVDGVKDPKESASPSGITSA
jgi:hypothetical protein